MELKYLKVGQKVKLKTKEELLLMRGIYYSSNNLELTDSISDDQICDGMFDFLGKIVTISEISLKMNNFFIQEDKEDFYWYPRWIEPITEIEKVLYGE